MPYTQYHSPGPIIRTLFRSKNEIINIGYSITSLWTKKYVQMSRNVTAIATMIPVLLSLSKLYRMNA